MTVAVMAQYDGGSITMSPRAAYRAIRKTGHTRWLARDIITWLVSGQRPAASIAWVAYGVTGYGLTREVWE